MENDPNYLSRRNVLQAATGALGVGAMADFAAAGPNDRVEVNVGFDGPPGRAAVHRTADEVQREFAFEAATITVPKQALKGLRNNPHVRYIEPNARVHAQAQELPWGVDRIDADRSHADGVTGDGADVAILDTGVDADHPDLEPNLGEGASFVSCGSSSCSNGNDCREDWDDDADHGTHCAGIAGAVDDADGVVGVAPEATLHAVKVLDGCGQGSFSDVAAGLEYVADRGWDVANMSLGASTGSEMLRDACQYAHENGVLLVASAGNGGPCSDCVMYPAAYNTVVAVSATAPDDSSYEHTTTGPEIDIAAPGVDVTSTVADGYASQSGTSMAAPHVAAAGGILMANDFTNREALLRLRGTAEDVGLPSNEQGAGLLDVAAATADLGGDVPVAVSTGSAENTSSGGVVFSGTLEDLGGADWADVFFEYRETGASGWTTTGATTRTTPGAFDETVEGLADGTEYEFRAVAAAADDDVDRGAAVTFSTPTADTPVAVATGDPTDVTTSSASLHGTLEDLGGADSADVAFEYREAGTASWTSTASTTRTAPGTVTTAVEGLADGTEYEFRAVATAADGDADRGDVATFATDSTAAAPTVDTLQVSEAGKKNPHARITADWSVSDADGDLSKVTVELYDGGRVVRDATVRVSGSSASGSEHWRLKHGGGTTYDVALTVTDDAGESSTGDDSVRA